MHAPLGLEYLPRQAERPMSWMQTIYSWVNDRWRLKLSPEVCSDSALNANCSISKNEFLIFMYSFLNEALAFNNEKNITILSEQGHNEFEKNNPPGDKNVGL